MSWYLLWRRFRFRSANVALCGVAPTHHLMEDASPRVSTVARAETTNVFADLDMQEITVRNIEINVNFGNSYYRSLIMIGENILSIKG